MSEAPEIRADRVAAVLAQTPLAVVVTMINAGLMAAVMPVPGQRAQHIAWFAAVLAIAALRLGLWQAWRRDPRARERIGHWGLMSIAGAGLAGLGWGAGVTLLWPAEEAGQLFWAFVLCGMCAGSAALHAAHPPTAMAFILPAGVPIAVAFAGTETERGLAAAAMSIVFILALAVTARRSARLFGAYVGAKLDLVRQAEQLDAVNASLRESIAHHRATEASLRQAQKMEAMGQLTGGIAHDFNNLLTAILGSLALLQRRQQHADARTARLLENARQAAERGAALTQRLLAFGRRQALNPVALDLDQLIGGMSQLLRGTLGGAIRVETHFPPDLPAVQADANQLELAVLNLALNARDAMPSGGTIVIAAEERGVGPGEEPGLEAGAYVVLSLADAGIGMDEATLARAMEPFFTTKGVGKGTGLGLAMVHGMAAQSGGRLTLRSRPGEGTVAALWLPRAQRRPAAPRREDTAPRAPVPDATVLLVDDDPLVLGSTAAMLEELGYRALPAASGAQALEILATAMPVALLLTDYGMPGMNGAELAEQARRLRPGVPVLVATGHGELPDLAASGLARLSKPFAAAALGRALAEQLDGKAPVASV